MLGKVAAAQFDLENAVAELARSGATTGRPRGQLQALGHLLRQIGTADPASLVAMRAEVSAAVTATQTFAQQSRAAAAEAATADALGLTGSAAASRAQVTALVQNIHRFDPYLRFSSPEEEEAYRQREAGRLAYIAAEHAKGTPEGDLNASAGAIGQMVDIRAHGGGDSPEFQQRWRELVTTTERLREEVRRSGGTTAEFDNRLREDLRRILHAKGLSDAQIDALFAANPDPLEAAKAYVGDADIQQIETRRIVQAEAALPAATAVAAPEPPAGVGSHVLAGAIGNLQDLGIVATDHDAQDDPAHGVTATNAPARRGSSLA